jgi:DNA repair exonuclease SbcCD ATPase subunit
MNPNPNIECPVCQEKYNRKAHLPLVLKCGHSVCKGCAQSIYRAKGKVECPLERTVDDRSPDDISTSYQILELIDMVAEMESQIRHLKLTPEERSAELLRNAEEGVKNAEESLTKIREAIDTVNGKKTEVLQEINESFDKLQKALEDRQLHIEQEVQ